MTKHAPNCRAGIYILVDRDGRLKYDMAGHERTSILWGLQKMVHELMNDAERYGGE